MCDTPTLLQTILANPKMLWNWRRISLNVNLSIDQILSHPETPWDWVAVSQIYKTYGGPQWNQLFKLT